MPNVLFVIPSLDVSGRGIQLSLLSRLLAKTVFKPHILCLGEEGQFAAQTRDAGVIVEAAGNNETSSFKSCYQVRKFCRKHEIDLVQTYLSGRELGSVRGARSAGITRIITSRREIPEEHSPVLRARKAANRKTDFIIANSQAAKDFCCSQEQWPSELVDVIPNGFPADRIPGSPALFSKKTRRYLQSFNLQPDEKVLVCIASFHEVKNHLVLLEAFRKLLFEKPLIRLILLGEGPLLAEVERYAGERSLGRAVACMGNRMDRLGILSECDALVLPSRRESFPNSILEAQALGIPVAASRCGGIPEIVTSGETGWLFDPDNTDEMAEAIRNVLYNTEAVHPCVIRAQEQVRRKFTAEKMVESHVHAFNSLLKQ